MAKKKPDYTEAQRLRDKGYTIKAISEMTGLCRFGIGNNTVKKAKPVKSIPKPKVLRKPKKVEPKPIQDLSKIEKGEVKIKKGLKVFQERRPDPKRHVYIPEMSMTVGVKSTDTRTDEEIRKYWLDRRLSEPNGLKRNYYNR